MLLLDQLGRNSEERVDRLTAAIDRRDPGRCQVNVLLPCVQAEVLGERRLSGSILP